MLTTPWTLVGLSTLLLAASIVGQRRRTSRRQATTEAIDRDARRLGVRRVTPARRWFSTFTLALLEEQGETIEGPLTLDQLDEPSTIVPTGGVRNDLHQLRDLAHHFRDRLITEEGGRVQPPLDHVWIGFGRQTERRYGRRRRRTTTVRIYNAADLGRQGLITAVERRTARTSDEGRPSRWTFPRERPVCVVVVASEHPTPAGVMDHLRSSSTIDSDPPPLVSNLLVMATNREPAAPTSQDLIDLIQSHGQRTARQYGTGAWCAVRWPTDHVDVEQPLSSAAVTSTTAVHWAITPPPIEFAPNSVSHTSSRLRAA